MRKTLATFALLVAASGARAQHTYTAATCNQTDVQTAVTNELAAAADGDIISIPAGTCTWTGATLTATFSHSVTVQGAGAISATTGGASTTGSDVTALTNHMGGNPFMQFTTTAGKSLRVTGIAFLEDGSSGSQGTGNLVIAGQSSSVRVDHDHFLIFVGGSKGLGLVDCVNGVADHDYMNTTQGVTNFFAFLNGANCGGETDGAGQNSWSATDQFGTNAFFYVEDTRFIDGYASDCSNGGRWVIRYSTMSGTNGMANHGTHDTDPIPIRGCRAAEVYGNVWDDTSEGSNGGAMEENNSGPALVWGNTTTKMRFIVGLSIVRQSNATYSEDIPPAGWGYCGNTQTGSTSVWDQNTTTNGYACLDQPGRGKSDPLTQNATWPNIFDTTTGTQTWPHNTLSPVYVWDNIYNDAGYSPEGCITDSSGILTNNKDYYQQFTATYCNPGSFNGTAGVGQGSSLPTVAQPTCTPSSNALPAGTVWLGVSVSGNWGPGYWDTTNSTLYICTATNTWTAYYTPYTYPNPLTGGSSSLSPPTFSPAAGNYATSQVVTLSDATSGATICYTTDGSTPTGNGAGTCTHGTTYSTAIEVLANETIMAIATKSGSSDSIASSAAYTLTAPTFGDLFNEGSLNTTLWQVNLFTYTNYVGAGSNYTSQAANCDLTTGVLRITLTQPTASTSTGCQLQSKSAFGYGTYEWSLRASTTSATPTGTGTTQSGQISTGFIISDATSKTEIDSPEIEGRTPNVAEFTNWLNGANTGAALITTAFNPQDAFHLYRFIWNSTSVNYYIDNVLVATHTTDVPLASNPGFVLIDHYGTNSNSFGGTATVGVTRYEYSNSFKYWSSSILTAATPSCTPTTGKPPQTVTCTDSSSGAIMCYTLNGGTPATNGAAGCTTGTLYSAPISVTVSSVLNVIAGGTGFTDSGVATYSYSLPAPGTALFGMATFGVHP